MEIVINALIFFAGSFSGFFASYLKQKAINRALREDNRELENQKKEVENFWSIKIEELKNTHRLDFEKRRHQYEDRRRLYSKFCADLDRYQSLGQEVLKEKSVPMIKKFLVALENSKEQHEIDKCFSAYFESTVSLCNDITVSFSEIKHQTNGLRLVTSEETEMILEALIKNMEGISEKSINFLKYLATPAGIVDEKGRSDMEGSLVLLDKENALIRERLIKQMRNELNTI